MTKKLLSIGMACAAVTTVHAQVLIGGLTGNSYTQDFDTLISSGTGTWVDNSTLTGWYAARDVGAIVFQASTGSSTSGSLYSFGVASSNERALGSIGSNSTGPHAYGVRFQNNTGDNVSNITITYTGEQWRNGGNTSAQPLSFSYIEGSGPLISIDSSNLLAWVEVPALQFVSPIVGSTSATLVGNDSANRVTLGPVVLEGVTLSPGEELILRWRDLNDGGNDHGLSVDDLQVSFTRAVAPPEAPTIVTQPQGATVAVGTRVTLTAAATGNPVPSYRWYRNGVALNDNDNISGATTSVLTINSAFHTNAGNYTFVASNSQGSKTSDAAVLTVEGFLVSGLYSTNTVAGTTVDIPIAFVDNQSSVTVSAFSGNTSVVPDQNISVIGTGNSRTLRVVAPSNVQGVSAINVTLTEGSFTKEVKLGLMVVPSSTISFNDYFDYADGSLVANSGALWTNTSGTFGDLQVLVGTAYLTRAKSEDVTARLAKTYTIQNGGSVYASYKLKLSSADTPTQAGAWFASFHDGNIGYRGRVWASTNGSAPGTYRLSVVNGSSGSATTAPFPLDLSYDTIYHVVVGTEVATGVSKMWINPTNKLDFHVTGSDGDPATNGVDIANIALRQNSGMSIVQIDEVVVSGSFDAATGLVSPVTDPIPLSIVKNPNGSITLNWADPAFTLQESTSLLPNSWTAVNGAASGFTTTPAGTKFYRLIAP